jgi:redox-sensitive bicupin YhaK (pirin superfamily)
MISLRPAAERGHANHGWLDSYHSFSFADYYDPEEMGYGALRVINEDRVQPGTGFGMHGHRDMEIITYLLAGKLEHKDNMGNGSIIVPGDVQRMSAGKGVLHSEYNPSRDEPVHFLQIWIEPSVKGIAAGYEQRHIAPDEKRGALRLIASPEEQQGAVVIHQDAKVYAALLDGSDAVAHPLGTGRRAYVHVARGSVRVNGRTLQAGDAAKISDETAVTLDAATDAEILLFDLP